MYRNGENPAERLALIGVSKLLKEHYDARTVGGAKARATERDAGDRVSKRNLSRVQAGY
jgi:hypothetical protein